MAEFAERKSQLTALESLAESGYIDVFYYDESHFGLTPSVPYAWQPKGQTIEIPSARGKYVTVAGFLSKNNTFYDYSFEKPLSAATLVSIFEDFIAETTKKTVVVLDNAPIHRAKLFSSCRESWQKEHDLWLVFLPPYSPELNLIEILWRKIKYEWLPHKAFLSFDNLTHSLAEVCSNIGDNLNINYV